MHNSRKRAPDLAIQDLHLEILNAFGQVAGGCTVAVEWTRAELEHMVPDGYTCRVQLPPPPDGHPAATWSIQLRAGNP